MRWRGGRASDQIEDRRGMRLPRGGMAIGGGGLILILLISALMGIDPTAVLEATQGVDVGAGQPSEPGPTGAPSDEAGQFAAVVLGSTEDVWNEIFAERGGRYEAPAKVFLGGWPDGNLSRLFSVGGARGQFTKWKVPELEMFELRDRVRRMREPFDPLPDPDSAVTMYWPVQKLGVGEKRELAFTYGLGQNVTGQSGGRLALSFGGRLVRGGEFTVTAYVSSPESGQTATLALPDGLQLADGLPAERPVRQSTTAAFSPVTWRVKALRQGEFEFTVRSGGVQQNQKVKITAKSFLD